jgi:phosphohistidine phosphatase
MVKKPEHNENQRTKPDWYYHQVAVLPFRLHENQMQIMLITSIKKKKWILPKGIVERSISQIQSAANEAYEEAGVKGTVINKPLGSYTVRKWRGVCDVRVYPMAVVKVLAKWPENYVRKRKWCTIEEALKSVTDKNLSQIIQRFESRISQYEKLLDK